MCFSCLSETRSVAALQWVGGFCLFLDVTGSKTGPWKRGRGKQWGLEKTRGKRTQNNYSYEKVWCLMVCEPYLRGVSGGVLVTHHPMCSNLSKMLTVKRFHGCLSEHEITDLTAKLLLEPLLFLTRKPSEKTLSESQQHKNVALFCKQNILLK